MLELKNKLSAFPSFSIKGNLRATIFVKKDDIYSFKKYDDLICDKECFNNKYKNFRQKILSYKNNSLGKLDEIENPGKKHHNKSKSVAYAAAVASSLAVDCEFELEGKTKSNNKKQIEKQIFINKAEGNDTIYNTINKNINNNISSSSFAAGFQREFEIENYKIKEPKKSLIFVDHEKTNNEDIYFSGKKIINLMHLNSHLAVNNHNSNNLSSSINKKNNSNQTDSEIESFNLASYLKNKINLSKIQKPEANEDEWNDINDNYLDDYDYNLCLNKLENQTLLKNLEDCDDEVIDEIDENNNNIDENGEIELLIPIQLTSDKKLFSPKKANANAIVTCEEKDLLQSFAPNKKDIYNYNFNSEYKNNNIQIYNQSELFKTKTKNNDCLSSKSKINNHYKKSHIASTDAPEKSFISNTKQNLEQNSRFILNTNENLRKIDFNLYDNDIIYCQENSETNSENITVSEKINIDVSSNCYLNSVSHKVNKQFKQAFNEVQNIKKNLFLTEEEFRKSKITLQEGIEKDFGSEFSTLKESGEKLRQSKSKEKLHLIQDAHALKKVNLFSWSGDNIENNKHDAFSNKNFFGVNHNKNYNDSNNKNNPGIYNCFDFKNFRIEDSCFSGKKNKMTNEDLTSLDYSGSKAAEAYSAFENNDEISIRGRSHNIIESENKPISNCYYYFNTADDLKTNFNEINFSKYKIIKQDCQGKENGKAI